MHKFFLLLVLTASIFALPLPADEQLAGSGGLSPESIQKSLSSALKTIKENPGLLNGLKDKLSQANENKSSTTEGTTTPEGVKATSDAHALLTETPNNGESKQSSSDSESSDKSSGNTDSGATDEKNTNDAQLLKPEVNAAKETLSSDKVDKTDEELLKPATNAAETKAATTDKSDSSTSAAVALTDLTPEDAQKAVQSTPVDASKEQIEKAADT